MQRIIASVLCLFLSLLSIAIAQENGGSGLPFITAAPPSAGTIVGGTPTPTATAQVSGPVSQGAASQVASSSSSAAVVLSGTRSTGSSSLAAIITSAGGPASSGGLVLDSTGVPSPTGASQTGTTVTHTSTATAAGNIAPTNRAGSWQSWLAVMVGGVAVAAGLM